MKFRVALPGMNLYPGTARHWWEDITTGEIRKLASEADRLGYDFITVGTHLGMHAEDVPQMGTRWVDSLTAAGFLLGATSRVKIVPLVIIPFFNPVMLAQSIATLDYVSGSRVIPLALCGYKRWEFEAVGVPYDQRGRRMDESLSVMRLLWSTGQASFQGEFTQFSDLVLDPRPRDGLPMWVGGHSKPAFRRVARFGDAWVSTQMVRDEVPEVISYIKSQPEFQASRRRIDIQLQLFQGDRDPYTHEVRSQPRFELTKSFILDQVGELAVLGATILDASMAVGSGVYQNDQPGAPPPTRSASEYIERLQWFAEDIMPEARLIGADNAPD